MNEIKAPVSNAMSPIPNNPYSPSVPISVYREVAAELQAAQAMLESLQSHNQQLVQQNQQLRRELESVMQMAMQLQNTLNAAQAVSQMPLPPMPQHSFNFNVETAYPPVAPVPHPPTVSQSAAPTSAIDLPFLNKPNVDNDPWNSGIPVPPVTPEPLEPEKPELFTEEPPEKPYQQTSQSRNLDMGGIWLTVAIVLIMAVAFGAGFFFVRPLFLPKGHSK